MSSGQATSAAQLKRTPARSGQWSPPTLPRPRSIWLISAGSLAPLRAGYQPPTRVRRKSRSWRARRRVPKLLPDTPISLPKLRAADVKLRYRGDHIVGRSVPLDNLVVNLSVINGKIALEPISFGVGRGRIAGTVALDGSGDVIRAKAAVDFEHVDVARLMAATHMFEGAGAIGGHMDIVTSGNSLAQMLGNGGGGLRLLMTGGDLSALLVNLSGLEFGNALLSALGMPKRTPIECMIADFSLQKGLFNTRTFLLVTKEANVHGAGSVNLRNETVNVKLNTEAAHFSIGSLHAPINISGPLKSPSIRPELGELAARGGVAGALAVLMPPLAILPTIEFGQDESRECAARISSVRPSERAKAAPAAPARAPARRRGR